jgi:hypothetical protein
LRADGWWQNHLRSTNAESSLRHQTSEDLEDARVSGIEVHVPDDTAHASSWKGITQGLEFCSADDVVPRSVGDAHEFGLNIAPIRR